MSCILHRDKHIELYRVDFFSILQMLTSILRQLSTVDLVLHHISPIEGALAEMEVKGDGVPQAWHQHAELSFIQIDAADLVAV